MAWIEANTNISNAYTNKYGNGASSMSTSVSLTGLEKGKNYLLLAYSAGTTNLTNTYQDGATCTNGTLTKINNIITVGTRHAAGTAYNFKPTSTSSTITLPNSGWVQVYEC